MSHLPDRESELIQAAKELVVTQGVEGLNARAVAAKAGCAVGTLYNYFKNMTDLILMINAQTLLAMKQELEKAGLKRARKDLSRSISRTYISFVKSHLPLWKLLYEYQLPNNQKLPEWYQQLIDDIFIVVEKALNPYLSQNPAEAKLAVRVLWAGLHGILILETTGKLDLAHNESAEILCDSLFDHYLKS